MPPTMSLSDSTLTAVLAAAQDKIRVKEDELLAQLRTKFPVQIDDGVLATVRVDLAAAGSAADAGKD